MHFLAHTTAQVRASQKCRPFAAHCPPLIPSGYPTREPLSSLEELPEHTILSTSPDNVKSEDTQSGECEKILFLPYLFSKSTTTGVSS